MSTKRPGLGTITTRAAARDAAARIEPAQENGRGLTPVPATEVLSAVPDDPQPAPNATQPEPEPRVAAADENQTPAAPAASAPAGADDKDSAEVSAPAPEPARAKPRRQNPPMPTGLTPSRQKLNRIQIGPRLRPKVKDRFDDYADAVKKTGLTQSDLVESALTEYMDRYPAEVLVQALLGDE